MKNSPTSQPRFTCRVVRGWISIFGDATGGEPRGLGAAHLAGCEECREFFGACDELALALKRDAAREWREPPGGLEQKIMRAVNQSAPAPCPRAARHLPAVFAGVAACAAVAAVVLLQSPPPLAVSRSPVAVAVAPRAPAVAPDQVWASLKPSTDALLAGDPLQHEVDAVVSDARTAFRFLERNFLPSMPETQGRSG